MRRIMIVSGVVIGLALSACTEAEQDKANAELDQAGDTAAAKTEAAADKIAAEAKELANDPKVKEAGAEVKEAASDAGKAVKKVTGDALVTAGSKIKEGAGEEPEKK